MKIIRKVTVPAYEIKENTVVDRYMCEQCGDILKDNRREVLGKRKRNSYIYYGICIKCK